MCDFLALCDMKAWDSKWDERCGDSLVEPQRWCHLEWADLHRGLTSKEAFLIETICRIVEIVPLILITLGAYFLALIGNSCKLTSAFLDCGSETKRLKIPQAEPPTAQATQKPAQQEEEKIHLVRSDNSFVTFTAPLTYQFTRATAHIDCHLNPKFLPNDGTLYVHTKDKGFYYPANRLSQDIYVAQHPLENQKWRKNRQDFWEVIWDARIVRLVRFVCPSDNIKSYAPKLGYIKKLDGSLIMSEFAVKTESEKDHEGWQGQTLRTYQLSKGKEVRKIEELEITWDPLKSPTPDVIAKMIAWFAVDVIVNKKTPVLLVDKMGYGPRAGVFAVAHLIYERLRGNQDRYLVMTTTHRAMSDKTGRAHLLENGDQYRLLSEIAFVLEKFVSK